MEYFNKYKAVKLRSHLGKYLVANDDLETVSQSRNASSRRAIWEVELIERKSHYIHLKSCHGRYLTATDLPFLLGMTGEKALQTKHDEGMDWKFEWEPIKEGFQVKLRSWCGKYLRGNGGTPPWRNSVTHDDPHTTTTMNWILWDVEPVGNAEVLENVDSFTDSVLSSKSSLLSFEEEFAGPVPGSPSLNSNIQPKINSGKYLSSGMDFFHNAKAVRLRSHHDKYLQADEDEESITQDRNGSSNTVRFVVEFVPEFDNIIRLKSCFGKYLTASNQPFLLGMSGRKVLQTLPRRLDSSVEWEPVREGTKVKLKTRYGHFLRANGGLPPWRNSVTHDIPHRTSTQDWILWDVDVVEIQIRSPGHLPSMPPLPHSDSLYFESNSPSSVSVKASNFSRQESCDSDVSSLPRQGDGRIVYYHIAEDNGEVDDESVEGYSLNFKGSGVEGLTHKLEEETGLEGIIVCTRSPLNGRLYPLRLHLPPNNTTMHVVVVLASSKAGKEFENEGLL